jgi:hypothetical protein
MHHVPKAKAAMTTSFIKWLTFVNKLWIVVLVIAPAVVWFNIDTSNGLEFLLVPQPIGPMQSFVPGPLPEVPLANVTKVD